MSHSLTGLPWILQLYIGRLLKANLLWHETLISFSGEFLLEKSEADLDSETFDRWSNGSVEIPQRRKSSFGKRRKPSLAKKRRFSGHFVRGSTKPHERPGRPDGSGPWEKLLAFHERKTCSHFFPPFLLPRLWPSLNLPLLPRCAKPAGRQLPWNPASDPFQTFLGHRDSEVQQNSEVQVNPHLNTYMYDVNI